VTPRRITIVYGRVGGGHLSAAQALRAALLDAAPGTLDVELADAYGSYARPPVSWFPAGYAKVVRNHPRFWSLFFESTQVSGMRFGGDALLGPFLSPGFRRLLREQPRDVVVSVLPAINGLLAGAAQRTSPSTRVEVVVTDFCGLHRSWRGRGVDRYTVATDRARLDLVRYGVSPAAVDVVGLPVRPEFVDPPARSDARAWLASIAGLDPDRFTVVVLVGAEGSPAALATVQALARLDADAQVVVACGHDARLRERVADLPHTVELRALGFVTEAALLMRSADVLVSKAGGASLAEAFCCQSAVVVADVLPGQEAGNLEYVLQRGAVDHADGPAATAALVAGLARWPSRRTELASRAAQLARPHAAAQIARRLVED
jgi:UDP-N-acetylglucosamine:LPS N-acetylglucosamine transferase